MRFIFRWSWCILFFVLLVPIDLPAGGSLKKDFDDFHIEDSNLYFASNSCSLRTSPSFDGHLLNHVSLGTPLRFVRSWQSIDGQTWFQVQISSFEFGVNGVRGWINV